MQGIVKSTGSHSVLVLIAALISLSSIAVADDGKHEKRQSSDPVVLTFSSVGDSRQDPVWFDSSIASLTAQDKLWLQNSKALSRIMRTIAEQKSQMLVFNGDMIMGYGIAGPVSSTEVSAVVNSDLMIFYRQYAFWRGMAATLMESGTYVVPVPGNHEVQAKSLGKKAVVENENAWRANMGDLILDTERFKAIVGTEASHVNTQNNGAHDGLSSDQSQLSYSFDVGESHFVIINTDPVGGDNTAPTKWLANDLQDALFRKAKNLFVFGHKPAYSYSFSMNKKSETDGSGLSKYPDSRDAFWNVIEQFGATYFCGHEHEFHVEQPKGKAWQILVGTGGSPFGAKAGELTRNPATDRTYAWVTVQVHRSGRAVITAYGFSDTFGSTHVLKRIKLERR